MTQIRLNKVWHLGPQLKRGGFGAVREAWGADGREAVAKLIVEQPGADRELLFGDSVDGAHIVPVWDQGPWHEYLVLVMPKAERSLRDTSNFPLPTEEAVQIAIDVATALQELGGSVIHRDIKPENILLLSGRWCLADFGIARYAEATTARETWKGALSPPYAAPEQWRLERATPATDVYALGCVLYELLSGEPPFGGYGTPVEDLRLGHVAQAAAPITDQPASLNDLLADCLAKAPEARPTPSDMLRRLSQSNRVHSSAESRLQTLSSKLAQERHESMARDAASAQRHASRATLAGDAAKRLERMRSELFGRLWDAAPQGRLVKGKDGEPEGFELGDAKLLWPASASSGEDALAYPGFGAPFSVIASTYISVSGAGRDYRGRAHSIWFADPHTPGRFAWHELAFMFHPLTARSSRIDPFALGPSEGAAAEALAPVMGEHQVAWPIMALDTDEIWEDFIERWFGWLVDAAEGKQHRPRTMPERDVGTWRRG